MSAATKNKKKEYQHTQAAKHVMMKENRKEG
jgi:hypothetical protein